MVQDDPVNVRLQLMTTPIISPLLVDPEKAREALKAALLVVKVVTQHHQSPSIPRLLFRQTR